MGGYSLGKVYLRSTKSFENMLNLYVAVGGLPDAVNAFLRTNNEKG